MVYFKEKEKSLTNIIEEIIITNILNLVSNLSLQINDAKSKEIGYSLAKDAWGRGYMTEAATEVIRYAFEDLGMEILTICTSPVNKRSQRVAKKNGFTYEGRIRKAYRIYTGELRDSLVFSLTKEEWVKNPKPEVDTLKSTLEE